MLIVPYEQVGNGYFKMFSAIFHCFSEKIYRYILMESPCLMFNLSETLVVHLL